MLEIAESLIHASLSVDLPANLPVNQTKRNSLSYGLVLMLSYDTLHLTSKITKTMPSTQCGGQLLEETSIDWTSVF